MAGFRMESEVIIVGFGPVGAMAANLLGQYGISTRVFEKLTDIYFAPRAICMDAEAIRTFGMIGLAEWIDQHLCKHGADLRTAAPPNGQVLIDMSDLKKRQRYGCTQLATFHQPTVEKKLREQLENFPNVQVNLGHEVTDILDENGEVYVTVRPVSSHVTETFVCKYLLACDGGRSFVRRKLGLKYHGFSIPEHWLVMDVICKDLSDDWPNSTLVTSSRRAYLYAKLPGNMRRIEILLKENEKALSVVREENTAAMLSEIGFDVNQLTFERRMVYKFHARAVSEWRRGHILLLGDAAHCMPPTKGQGLCCGMEDAANLCWKIAMLCRGNLKNEIAKKAAKKSKGTGGHSRAGDGGAGGGGEGVEEKEGHDDEELEVFEENSVVNVLDSYQTERQPWVVRQTKVVVFLRRMATLSNPVAVAVRNFLFRLTYVYGREFLISESYKGKPDVWSGLIHSDSPGSGAYFIQPSVTAQRSEEEISSVPLDEVLGPLWCWLTYRVSPKASLSEDHYEYLQSIGCRFVHSVEKGTNLMRVKRGGSKEAQESVVVDDGDELQGWMRKHRCSAVLIRPDRFVFGTASAMVPPPGQQHCIDSLRSILHGEKGLTVRPAPKSRLPVIVMFVAILFVAFLLYLALLA